MCIYIYIYIYVYIYIYIFIYIYIYKYHIYIFSERERERQRVRDLARLTGSSDGMRGVGGRGGGLLSGMRFVICRECEDRVLDGPASVGKGSKGRPYKFVSAGGREGGLLPVLRFVVRG